MRKLHLKDLRKRRSWRFGNERHVAKKVLSDFVRRQAWPYEHTDEMHAKIFINYGVMSAKQVAEELANKIGHSEPSLIQHVTDDQDMLQDVLDSASATGFVESRVYRALRIMLEQKRGNESGVEMVALSSRLSKAVVRAADKSEHPNFSETAGKVFGCYTDAPMEWVELRHEHHPVFTVMLSLQYGKRDCITVSSAGKHMSVTSMCDASVGIFSNHWKMFVDSKLNSSSVNLISSSPFS